MPSALLVVEIAGTGSGPILVHADDGQQYWLKWPGNPHDNFSLVSELVVAELGTLLDIPVRPWSLVWLDPELVKGSWFRERPILGGTCFGSLRLAAAEESTEAERTRHDSNARRYAGLVALWDLCLGEDLQLLHDLEDDSAAWSVDHGVWFGNTAAETNADSLRRMLCLPWPPFTTDADLDQDELLQLADRVEALPMDRVADLVSRAPVEWNVPEPDLQALAGFIWARRHLTAQNLRTRSLRR